MRRLALVLLLSAPAWAATNICFLGNSITGGFGSSPTVVPGSLAVADINTYLGSSTYAANTFAVNGTNSTYWTPTGGNHVTDAITSFDGAGGCAGGVVYTDGTNDANGTSTVPATFNTNVTGTVNALLTHGYSKVILNYSPYLNNGNTAANALLLQYETELAKIAAANPSQVKLGDQQAYIFFQNNTSQFQADGIHPNNTGYASLAQLWANAYINDFISPSPFLFILASGPMHRKIFTASFPTQNLAQSCANASNACTTPAMNISAGDSIGFCTAANNAATTINNFTMSTGSDTFASFTLIKRQTGTSLAGECYYKLSPSASGSTTATITWNAGTTTSLVLFTFRNATGLDTTATSAAFASGTTPINCPT